MAFDVSDVLNEVRAELAGVRHSVEHLDMQMRRWRDVTNTAFNLITQREASEDSKRRERQRQIDLWLRVLTIGTGVCLLLLIVLVALFIGSRLA